MGENVIKIRHTQKGKMIFELKRDPAGKSLAERKLVAKGSN